MCESLVGLFENSVMTTLASVLFGGLITWLMSWRYYKKAGNELKAETALIRKMNMAVLYMLEHPGAKIEVHRDDAGNFIGLNVQATARAESKSIVAGVGSNAIGDS